MTKQRPSRIALIDAELPIKDVACYESEAHFQFERQKHLARTITLASKFGAWAVMVSITRSANVSRSRGSAQDRPAGSTGATCSTNKLPTGCPVGASDASRPEV